MKARSCGAGEGSSNSDLAHAMKYMGEIWGIEWEILDCDVTGQGTAHSLRDEYLLRNGIVYYLLVFIPARSPTFTDKKLFC